MNEQQYCEQQTYQSGSSFYYSFIFLKPPQQQAIHAIYAFCNEVDNIVDEIEDKSIANTKLTWWLNEIEQTFNDNPQHPITKQLVKSIKHFNLKKQYFLEIINGMFMDIKYAGYEKFDDLKVYCHCVASAVGLLCIDVFGYQNPVTIEYAKNLGIALQLVNIIRDIGEDADRGRIYIPEQELTKFNLTTQQILSKNPDQADFLQLMKYQANRARNYYQKSLTLLPVEDRYQQQAGLIMAKIYFTLLDEIENSNFNILHHRISLTPIRKLWLAIKTIYSERKYKNIVADKSCLNV